VQIAPVIHEWTYDAMLHDLIDLQDHNTFKYDVSASLEYSNAVSLECHVGC
jgi:hypothetical protein